MAGAGEGPVQEAVEIWEDEAGSGEAPGRWWTREPHEGDQGWNWDWRNNGDWYDDWDDDGGFPLLGVLATLAMGIVIGVVLGSMGR